MSNFSLDDVKKNLLLNMASKKLGTDPNTLREKIDSGNLQDVVEGLDPNAKEQIGSFLKNPDALNSLLANEQVQALLKNLKSE